MCAVNSAHGSTFGKWKGGKGWGKGKGYGSQYAFQPWRPRYAQHQEPSSLCLSPTGVSLPMAKARVNGEAHLQSEPAGTVGNKQETEPPLSSHLSQSDCGKADRAAIPLEAGKSDVSKEQKPTKACCCKDLSSAVPVGGPEGSPLHSFRAYKAEKAGHRGGAVGSDPSLAKAAVKSQLVEQSCPPPLSQS